MGWGCTCADTVRQLEQWVQRALRFDCQYEQSSHEHEHEYWFSCRLELQPEGGLSRDTVQSNIQGSPQSMSVEVDRQNIKNRDRLAGRKSSNVRRPNHHTATI